MPDIYFNPYPGSTKDSTTGIQILLKTALAVESLRNSIGTGINPEGDCPISNFTLVRDSTIACQLNISDLLPSLEGHNRIVVSRLYSLFSRGRVLSQEMLENYSNLTFKALDTPAPVLEFALIHDGMTSSFATDQIWKSDFLDFVETSQLLPNIWGQEDLSQIISWIEGWYERNNEYLDELKRKFNAVICKGSLRSGDLCKDEWYIIFSKLTEAGIRSYKADGYMIKDVDITLYGPMKQIKHLGTGLRLYISISADRIIVGGFYKKGHGSESTEKTVQGKAISKAKKRINVYYADELLKNEENKKAEEAVMGIELLLE